MTNSVKTTITGADVVADSGKYPYATTKRLSLLDMNKRIGLTTAEQMILPGRDIKIEIAPGSDGKSDICAVRFNWSIAGGNSALAAMIYASPGSPYAALAETEVYNNTSITRDGKKLTPLICLTIAHDPGPSRMEVFNGKAFRDYVDTSRESLDLAAPLLSIAQKLASGQAVDLPRELAGTPYAGMLQRSKSPAATFTAPACK